jgi:hypothetical protein
MMNGVRGSVQINTQIRKNSFCDAFFLALTEASIIGDAEVASGSIDFCTSQGTA